MAAEKLAKSFLCHGSNHPPRESHAVISSFIRSCNSNRRLRDRFQMEHLAFSSMLRKHVRVAEYVESLAPAVSDNINVEYPWLDALGHVIAPCDHSFGEVPVTDMAQFTFFLERLLKIQAEL